MLYVRKNAPLCICKVHNYEKDKLKVNFSVHYTEYIHVDKINDQSLSKLQKQSFGSWPLCHCTHLQRLLNDETWKGDQGDMKLTLLCLQKELILQEALEREQGVHAECTLKSLKK